MELHFLLNILKKQIVIKPKCGGKYGPEPMEAEQNRLAASEIQGLIKNTSIV